MSALCEHAIPYHTRTHTHTHAKCFRAIINAQNHKKGLKLYVILLEELRIKITFVY